MILLMLHPITLTRLVVIKAAGILSGAWEKSDTIRVPTFRISSVGSVRLPLTNVPQLLRPMNRKLDRDDHGSKNHEALYYRSSSRD